VALGWLDAQKARDVDGVEPGTNNRELEERALERTANLRPEAIPVRLEAVECHRMPNTALSCGASVHRRRQLQRIVLQLDRRWKC